MVSGKKNIKQKIIRSTIFIIGFMLCCFPLISGFMENQTQRNAISTYKNDVVALDDNEIKSELHLAQKYNSVLYQTLGSSVGNSTEILSDESYNDLLDFTDTGIMGSIEIPKINVNLPIYHGTDEEILTRGIGHVQETSLPVGGKNTRSVLTGHRGLPTSKLFTRLDELDLGDYFFINICNETLAYQINDIIEIEPEEVEKLNIMPDKDIVSLITCTPYGINTHRLVVSGERVEYMEIQKTATVTHMMSIRELIFTALPFVFLFLVIVMIVNDKRKEYKEHEKEN